MKKLIALVLVASFGLFSIGCGGEAPKTPAKTGDTKASGATKAEEKKTEDKK